MTWVLLPAVAAFAISLLLGPATIGYLRRLRFGQQVREDGPQSHRKKSGTPTMGGVLILFAAAAAALAFSPSFRQLPYALAVMVGFGLIGLVDDALKVVARRSLGLKARQKLAGQILFAAFFALFALTHNDLGSWIRLPFSADRLLLPSWLYVLLTMGAVMGAANAVNLTDGLDGLAAGASAIAASGLAAMAVMIGHVEAAVLAAAVAGACLGFSWYNAHPAQVFMGDTGSLALGAGLAACAVLLQAHLFLLLIGGLFVVETLSVVLQVAYFRLTGGRRIFRMSPLHHHFELSGWAEPQVVIRFWLVGIVFAAAGVLALRPSL